MKKYLVILFLSLVLLSCGKTETQPITNELPKNTQKEISENKNNLVVENSNISNTGEIIQTGSGENVTDNNLVVENSNISNTGEIIQTGSENVNDNINNELTLCNINNYGVNDFESSKENLGIKLFGYKNYKNGWLLMSKPIDYNDNKYFTLTYYAFENVKGGEQAEKIEIYNMNCNKNISNVIHVDKGGMYKGLELLGVSGDNLYTYEYIGDGAGMAVGQNYLLNINTKKYERVFDYITIYNGSEKIDTKTKSLEWAGEGDVIFNKDFTKAIKYQGPAAGLYWEIDRLKITKESYLLVTDILTKKTNIINDGIKDYLYMNYKYNDFIKWIDDNTIEITMEDGTKKNIIIN